LSAGDLDRNPWRRTLLLHTGWTSRYDGSEAPEGGHRYLHRSVGVESENFRPVDGWCYGYAPVSRAAEGRCSETVPVASRTVKIEKLGARLFDEEVEGITVVWTAKRPGYGPVVVGLFDDAIVSRYMAGLTRDIRPSIARARAGNCHLIPEARRVFQVPHSRKGFPGMGAAWFAGRHADGPAADMLADLADYLPGVRGYTHAGERVNAPITAGP